MLRSRAVILGTVSALALLSFASATQAVTPATADLGVLRPLDQWKVGTVDSRDGASYCAMVGRFDKGTVLAVARSPQGYGSIAIDLRDEVFEPGRDYTVALQAAPEQVRNFTGRASSSRSIVIQIGQDDSFFDSLGAGSTLEIGMPVLNVGFAVRQFSGFYSKLVDCAGEMAEGIPAVKVKEVEQASLAPIDEEVAKLSLEKDRLAQAGTTARGLQSTLVKKSENLKTLDSNLNRRATADARASEKALSDLTKQIEALQEQIAGQKDEIKNLREGREDFGQKLLASLEAEKSVDADKMKEQLAEALKVQQSLQEELQQKEAEIARLEKERADEAAQVAAIYADKEQQLKNQLATLQKESDKLQEKAGENKSVALEKELAARDAKIAQLSGQRQLQVEELSAQLAETKSFYEQKLASLKADKADVQSRLDMMHTSQPELEAKGKQAEELAQKLAASDAERKELFEQINVLDRQNQLLQVALEGKEKELSDARSGGKTLSSVQDELTQLRQKHESETTQLKKQLEEKTAQYLSLQEQVSGQSKEMAKADAVFVRLSEKVARVAALEQQLKEAEAQRQVEIERAAKAQFELVQAREQLATMKETLGADQEKLSSLRAALDVQKAEIEKKEAALRVEAERLGKERAEIATLIQQKADVEKARSEQNLETFRLRREREELSALKKELEARPVAEPVVDASLAQMVEQQKTELQEARTQVSHLEEQLFQSQQRMVDLDRRAAELDQRERALNREREALENERLGLVGQNSAPLAKTGVGRVTTGNRTGEVAREASVVAPLAETLNAIEPAAGPAPRSRSGLRFPWEKDDAQSSSLERVEDLPVPQAVSVPVEEVVIIEEAPVVEPVAPQKAVQPAAEPAKDIIWEEDKAEEQVVVQEAPVVEVMSEQAEVALTAPEPQVQEPQPQSEKRASTNRAAALLERIMAYHRTTGDTPLAETIDMSADIPMEEEGQSVANWAEALPAPVEPEAPLLAEDETFMPPVTQTYVREELAASVPAEENSLISISPTVSLTALLQTAGISATAFIPADVAEGETVRQWSEGTMSGMFEQTAAKGTVEEQAQAYLDRYRRDCADKLKVDMGPVETAESGLLLQAQASCGMPDNNYVVGFVFLQDGNNFNTVLNTGYPLDASRVASATGRIADSLKGAGRLVLSSGANENTASVEPVRLKLNVPPLEEEAVVAPEDFETIVIQ